MRFPKLSLSLKLDVGISSDFLKLEVFRSSTTTIAARTRSFLIDRARWRNLRKRRVALCQTVTVHLLLQMKSAKLWSLYSTRTNNSTNVYRADLSSRLYAAPRRAEENYEIISQGRRI